MTKYYNNILLVISSLISFVILELGIYFLVHNSILKINNNPSYYFPNVLSRFWVDINPNFGVWHKPYSTYRHISSCFDVTYEANSYGARDIERSLESNDHKRVIMLGDSFIEGFTVPLEKRLSNLLEKKSGMEHLNFGTAGNFGTTQYYLMYKTLAKKFEHHAILIGILPKNDFSDDDYEWGKKNYSQRYRPYWVGQYPNYKLIYYQKKLDTPKIKYIKGILREYTYTYHIVNFITRKISSKFSKKDENKRLPYSGYYDFEDRQFDIMKYSLKKIVAEAERKEIYVFTIPTHIDLKRYDSLKIPPLSQKLESFSKEIGVTYLDLLPYMYKYNQQWEQYYSLPCDGHWNEYGNFVASQYLLNNLPLYTHF